LERSEAKHAQADHELRIKGQLTSSIVILNGSEGTLLNPFALAKSFHFRGSVFDPSMECMTL